jgi:hypothetical protein
MLLMYVMLMLKVSGAGPADPGLPLEVVLAGAEGDVCIAVLEATPVCRP